MRLLLDTHVVLWALAAPERLEPGAREAIADPANEAWASAVSVWECGIKRRLGRLRHDGDLGRQAAASGLALLAFDARHAHRAGLLPLLHADPFDHALIAQAAVEDAVLVTREAELFARYGVRVLAA